jgi:hypothetical protein
MGFEIHMEVTLKITGLWGVMSCNLVGHCLHCLYEYAVSCLWNQKLSFPQLTGKLL